MKISVFGIPDFPYGKKALPDERLKKLSELYRSQKITQIQVEFGTDKDLKTADAIICLGDKKLDLIILDMEVLEARLLKELTAEQREVLASAQAALEKETPLSQAVFSLEQKKWLANNNFVTVKPVIFITRQDLENLPALTARAYAQGGMVSFLTGGVKESRAWALRENSTAVDAAGCIHSDLARGFIRAEVMAYADLLRIGNVNQAKQEGCLRQEGKEYIVKDGDIIEFKFSV